MKIAIHHRKDSFSERWINYCVKNKLNYIIVNVYDSNLIDKLNDCDYFLWHFRHDNHLDLLFAKQLIFSLELKGVKVFPNSNTSWHFDDKLGQKYLMESMNIQAVQSYVFYNKIEAKQWISNTDLPKVFKLRGGAGSSNVKLIKSKKEANRIIERMFSKGISTLNYRSLIFDSIKRLIDLKDRVSLINIFKYSYLSFTKREIDFQNNYVYFQDFIPNNNSDIRVIIIGKFAFAIERLVRKNDFRASGSGKVIFLDNSNINYECLKIAFSATQRIKSQCMAIDFVYHNNKPLIVEVSYGFNMLSYDKCKGYWDINLNWYEEEFVPQDWMINNLLYG